MRVPISRLSGTVIWPISSDDASRRSRGVQPPPPSAFPDILGAASSWMHWGSRLPPDSPGPSPVPPGRVGPACGGVPLVVIDPLAVGHLPDGLHRGAAAGPGADADSAPRRDHPEHRHAAAQLVLHPAGVVRHRPPWPEPSLGVIPFVLVVDGADEPGGPPVPPPLVGAEHAILVPAHCPGRACARASRVRAPASNSSETGSLLLGMCVGCQ